jgi:hypothetical protein
MVMIGFVSGCIPEQIEMHELVETGPFPMLYALVPIFDCIDQPDELGFHSGLLTDFADCSDLRRLTRIHDPFRQLPAEGWLDRDDHRLESFSILAKSHTTCGYLIFGDDLVSHLVPSVCPSMD